MCATETEFRFHKTRAQEEDDRLARRYSQQVFCLPNATRTLETCNAVVLLLVVSGVALFRSIAWP